MTTLPVHAVRKGQSQIYGIDILRFAAAFSVLIYHLVFAIWATPHPRMSSSISQVYRPYSAFTDWGWVGVEIFFVISGYVIAFTANGRPPIGFINSRVLRLVPAVIICSTIVIPALMFFGEPPSRILKEYIGSLCFLPLGPWVAGPYWTLPIEVIFYASILTLLLLNAFHRVETLGAVIGLSSTGVWLAYLGSGGLPIAHHLFFWLTHNRPPQLTLLHHGMFFALGITFWAAQNDGVTPRRVAMAIMVLFGAIAEIVVQATATADFMAVPVNAVVPLAIWIAAMLFLIAGIRWNEPISRMFGKARPIIRSLGLITFPLYLVHEPIGVAITNVMLGRSFSPLTSFATSALSVFLVAAVIALYLEPALRSIFHTGAMKLERRISARWAWLREPTKPLF